MKVLVTGAAGFIGSNLTLRLLEEGYDVTGVDNMSTGREENADDIVSAGCRLITADYGHIDDLIVKSKFDVVFHLGAIPRVLWSVEHPVETTDCNVTATVRLLEACRGNVGRFVFSSSSAVVGDLTFDQLPSREDLPRRPLSPYAVQKSTIEDFCRIYSELHGLDTICLRYFNVFGPRQYGDSPYSTVISAWCHSIKTSQRLRLDGSGEQSRDFCYIDNAVAANMLAATAGRMFSGDVVNIAHGETRSIVDVLNMFRSRFDVEVEQQPARSGDVFATYADIGRAYDILGYVPIVSFKEGLEMTWCWWNLM
jgi:nucleoside-diphosphate-sugar epimerase